MLAFYGVIFSTADKKDVLFCLAGQQHLEYFLSSGLALLGDERAKKAESACG